MGTCPNGHDVREGVAFCTTCGAELTEVPAAPDASEPSSIPGRRRRRWPLAVLALGVLIGAGMVVVLAGGHGDGPRTDPSPAVERRFVLAVRRASPDTTSTLSDAEILGTGKSQCRRAATEDYAEYLDFVRDTARRLDADPSAQVRTAELSIEILCPRYRDVLPSAQPPTSSAPAATSTSTSTTAGAAEPDSSVEKTGTGEYTVRFSHPTWGPVRLVTRQPSDDLILSEGEGSRSGEISMTIFDANGKELWSASAPGGYLLYPAGVEGGEQSDVDSPVDAQGNIFLNYFVGQASGITVLRPTADGMDDFGSLPDGSLRFAGSFGARVEDVEGDGTFEIAVESNSCEPSCADGAKVTTTYRWDGSGFAE